MVKFDRSWILFKRALQVLRENHRLLVFQAIITAFVCVIALFFLLPVTLTHTTQAQWEALADRYLDRHHGPLRLSPAGCGIFAGIYMLSMFMATFFNVAFYHEIFNALNGRPVSIGGGLRFAVSRLKAIAAWSLFAGLVGLAIKALERRVGWLGRWIVRLIGTAWSVASVFAIPVIIREESHANPVLFLKSSARVLKKTWGEALIGYAGLVAGNGLVLLALAAILAPCLAVCLLIHNFWLLLAGFLVWLAGAFVFSFLVTVAGQVYRCALFIYATEGVVPGPFEREEMDLAWKLQTGRKSRGE